MIQNLTLYQRYDKRVSHISQLPSSISNREIARLASWVSPTALEKVTVRYFGISEAQIDHRRGNNLLNSEGFNRDLLHIFQNKGGSRKVHLLKYSQRHCILHPYIICLPMFETNQTVK